VKPWGLRWDIGRAKDLEDLGRRNIAEAHGMHAWKNNYLHCDADKKCPFTGLVSIRGRILTGTVVSTKMHRTLVIRREYLHFIPKYSRYERRHKNLSAHVSPAFRVEEGDKVTVGQCRPLSKTVC
jgi:ribosomal protein uS17